MAAILYRAVRRIRRDLRAFVVVAVLVGVVGGTALALVAGARRTATAPDRWTAAFGGGIDAAIVQPSGPPRDAEVAALPAVESVTAVTFVGLHIADGPTPDSYSGEDVNTFAGTGLGLTGRIVDGRAADPAAPFEFAASRSFVVDRSARLGDRFAVQSFNQDQIDHYEFDAEPAGAQFTAVLVGVVESADDLDDPTPTVYFSTALLGEDVGIVSTIMGLVLADGTTLADVRGQLDQLHGGSDLALDATGAVSNTVRTSVDALAKGLWILAAVTAVASVVVLGTVLTRRSAVERADATALLALGATAAQRRAEAVVLAGACAVAGMVPAVALAVVGSRWFPPGFVRRLEPAPGVSFDIVAVGAGAGALLVALTVWVAVATARPARRPSSQPPRGAVGLSAFAPSPAASLGIRFGLSRGEREATSVVAAHAGAALSVLGLIGALVFGASLRELTDDGAKFGNTFDLLVGNGWFTPPVDLGETLQADPLVDGLLLLGAGYGRSGETAMELIGFEERRGGLSPVALEGRLPRAADEVAPGRTLAAALDLAPGDDLEFSGPDGPLTYRVVGIAVVPSLGINEGMGKGALMTMDGLRAVSPAAVVNAAGVRLTPAGRADVAAAAEHLQSLTQASADGGQIPSPIVNVDRVKRIPDVLVGLLSGLGLVVLTATIASSARGRRRDLAVLEALGARPRELRALTRWQSGVVAALPLAVGLPAGVVVGRLVFREFASRLGAVPGATVPWFGVVLVAVAAGVAAVLVGTVCEIRSRTKRPIALRTE